MNIRTAERYRNKFTKIYEKIFTKAIEKTIQPVIDAIPQHMENTQYMTGYLIEDVHIKEAYIDLYKTVGVFFAQKEFDYLNKKHNKQKSKVLNRKNEDKILLDIWEQVFTSYALKEAGLRIESVTGVTRTYMINILEDVFQMQVEEGLGVADFTRRIQKEAAKKGFEMAKWRAKRIAQTETGTASNRASLEGAKQTGITLHKVWQVSGITGEGERHTGYLELADGQPRPLDSDFLVGGYPMSAPLAPEGPAHEVINCKCGLIYQPV